ncbi:MAG TPA: UvrD-helicase domain-containing protein [Candidatus Margulisiibacteriota bacterium]|nr:UvrD-helicase domain-containing protein [Candidatus Margulisiibacteriota bacterium]
MSFNLDHLNPQQREAVLHVEGPLLVLAGAGSGKTRVLTHRIAHLVLQCGVPPERICAVTFTNKAAREMRERTIRIVEAGNLVSLTTFHSLGARILRRHATRIGRRNDFAIFDEADQRMVIRKVAAELQLSDEQYPPARLLAAIDRAKNDGLAPRHLHADAGDPVARILAAVYDRYQAGLAANNALDFGDLLLCTMDLFRQEPAVLALYQEQFQYLMVDEYQDTNRVQYQLMRLIGSAQRNVCVVGDDDQSIYRWRGADLRNILDFESDFPGARVLRLEQNYRSTKNILAAAGAVIQHNVGRKGKSLWTENIAGEPLVLYTALDERAEARYVVREIEQLLRAGYSAGDVAIFYRTNAQSRPLEEELVRTRLAYSIVGSTRFYDRKEVRDLLAYLRLIANPQDSVSLMRIINVPPRGIGKTSTDALERAAAARKLPLAHLLSDTSALGLTPTVNDRLAAFDALCARLRAAARTSVAAALRAVLAETGYLERLQAETTPEAEARVENVNELLSVCEEFDATAPEASLLAFLEQIALIADVDSYAATQERVTLMTLHNSKGLEFPVAFIIGMEEGLFPHERSLEQPDAIEEERRLCYVGFTRARQRLYLVHALQRHLFGRVQHNLPSRFLAEIPEPLLRREGNARSLSPDEPTVDYSYSQLAEVPRVVRRQRPVPGMTNDSGFAVGQRVLHAEFGPGVVRAVEGNGERTKLTVRFERSGIKKLIARYAALERFDQR